MQTTLRPYIKAVFQIQTSTIMAHRISDECTYCGACEPECPVNAISPGDSMYVIDEDVCVDCVGYNDEPACVAVCPVDCIAKV